MAPTIFAPVYGYQSVSSMIKNCMSYCFGLDDWGSIPDIYRKDQVTATKQLSEIDGVTLRDIGAPVADESLSGIFFSTSEPCEELGGRPDLHWAILTQSGWAHKEGEWPSYLFEGIFNEHAMVGYFEKKTNGTKYKNPIGFSIEADKINYV